MTSTALAEARLALDAVGKLPDAEIDIGAAALQFARIDAPEADWTAARDMLSAIARETVAQVTAEADAGDAEARRQVLAQVLHGHFGLEGDAESYDDLENANLIHVLERSRGLPVALGVLWLHAAEAAGWEAYGVDFPGHFLVALRGETQPVLVDVFHGGAKLEAPELRALIKRLEGEKAELKPGMLAAMPRRAVLLRLQNNIKLRRLRVGDVASALACAEDMLRIAPDHAGLWREVGLMNQRLERISAALVALERALELAPEDKRTRSLIDELRNRLN